MIPKLVWALIIGSGLTRGTYYMAFPFLAIHLKKQLGVDITTIGWVIGIGPLMGAVIGFYGAYLSDKFGRRKILTVAATLWGLVYMGFGFAGAVWVFALLSAASGILRAITEPIIQAVISDNTEGESRTRAYHLRYFAINAGVSVGPIIGAWILLKHPALGFVIAGTTMVLFAWTFGWMSRTVPEKVKDFEKPPGVLRVLSILANDRSLVFFVIASILCSIGFAQTDTTLPLVMESLLGERGIKFFGWVLAANSMTVVTFQLLLNRLTKGFRIAHTVAVSSLVFGLGFVGFALSGDNAWFYIGSMVVLALGEILVFSNGFILIDRLAPENLKATYHSSANLFALGLAIGPPLGGWILKEINSEVLFYFAAVLMVFCSLFYLLGDDDRQNQEAPVGRAGA